MADEPRLLVTLKDGVKRITFNAPERRNAVDRATSERLLEVVQETAHDDTKVVVLTGAGAQLSNNGGTIRLMNPQGILMHAVSYSKADAVESRYVRFIT